MPTIVVGGGLVGCAAVLLLQPDLWITDRVGGFLTEAPFPPGPQFLHKTPESELFLSELWIEPAEQLVKWNWVKNGKLLYHPEEEDLRLYAKKSRGNPDFPVDPSGGKTSFKSLRRLGPLAKKLRAMALKRFKKGKVELIERKIGLEGLAMKGEADWIVSTIPLGMQTPKMKKVHFQLWWCPLREIKLLRNRDYVYLLGGSPIYRVTKFSTPKFVVTESLVRVEKFLEGFQEVADMESMIQIEKPSPPDDSSGIFFVGRFATSNPEYMFHDAISDLYLIRSAIGEARREYDRALADPES